jgi:hypothetical protein
MRLLRPAFSFFSTLQRLRDPQVQVWVMVGCSLLLVLIGHLHAWNASGEGKNEARTSASRLLLAGARVEWSEEFAAAPRPKNRPVLNLVSTPFPVSKARTAVAAIPDVRPAMELASGQPWQALDRSLRSQLAVAGIPAAPLTIRLRWSGESRGNAALVARHAAASGAPDDAGFVIGNGSRSRDGEIEWLFRNTTLGADAVEITLIGSHGQSTPRQWAALAELLVHLEALSGHRALFAPPALSAAVLAAR